MLVRMRDTVMSRQACGLLNLFMLSLYSQDNRNALVIACQYGQVRMVEWLLTKGFDPNYVRANASMRCSFLV